MGVEAARRARHCGRDHRRDGQRAGGVDAHRERQGLVLLEPPHRPAEARADEARDDEVAERADAEHEVIVLQLGPERPRPDPGQPQRDRRDPGERERPLGQLDPVEGDEPHDLREGDRDDDEVGAAHPEGEAADQPAAGAGRERREHEPDRRRPGLVHRAEAEAEIHVEAEARQRAHVGADAEEGDVAEAELPGEAEEQVQAHGADRQDARHDQRVEQVGAGAERQRQGDEGGEEREGEEPVHPMRSAFANRPVGL
ncbi:hypothetical protein NBEOAGPD_4095 [Methylobacterium gregans]|uniref:Uncharacterized protein n=1 Tax=Methylobacterium gregans TaxID=374424 RepID=A0AA37MC86_9HYPH|nr:hypothetical protein NBEOAGPD_4095 [Methylobacterium gregans]